MVLIISLKGSFLMISGDLKCGNDNCNPLSVGFDSTDDCCGRKTKENMPLSALSRMYSVTAAILRKSIQMNSLLTTNLDKHFNFRNTEIQDYFQELKHISLFFRVPQRVPHSLEACLWFCWLCLANANACSK